ncbi:MAG: Fur family transcriptional regulator [Actinomycetota bacterium]|nr:transcriptional repressor [Actinomycetota bacterium]
MLQTRQRTEVLDALRGGEAFAAQELHDRLRARGSKTGLATVYRALRKLADEGAVDVIREDPVQARYRLCSPEHHHHLLCESCGKVTEIPQCDIEGWAKKVARKQGFVVRTHRAEILGLCATCSRR